MRDADDIPAKMARVTVGDAARILGISTGAVRNRLSRGTLKSVNEDGTVYVLLSADISRDVNDIHGDIPGESTALISAKDETIRILREQLEAEREQLTAERGASAELRRIIAGLVQRVPELEPAASPKPPEAPETASETEGKSEEPPEEERRPWWQKMFGG